MLDDVNWKEGRLYDLPSGRAFRVRRGKLVEIPQEWIGKVTYPQTIGKRNSKNHHQKVRLNRQSKVFKPQVDWRKDWEI